MGIETHQNFKKIDAFVKNLIKVVETKQADFFVKHKTYFNGLKNPAVGQLDGTTDEKIAYALCPGTRSMSWLDFSPGDFNDKCKFPVHAEIEIMESPEDGFGWSITFELFKEGLGVDAAGREGEHWVYRYVGEGSPDSMRGTWDNQWHIEVPEG